MIHSVSPSRFSATKLFLYGFLFLLPLRNIVEKVPNLFGIEGLGSTHILFLLAFAAAFLQASEPSNSNKPKLSFPIFLFLIYLLFETFITDSSITPLDYRIKVWKDQVLLMSVYFIVLRGFQNQREILFALVVMCVANFYMDLYFWRWVRWTQFAAFNDKLKSVNGTFGSVGGPNEWAAFYSTYTPILFTVLPAIRKKLLRTFCWGLAIINIYVLLFTFSRGAYVGTIAALLWFIVLKKKIIWLISLILFLLSYSFLLPTAVVDRIEMTTATSEYGTVQDQDVQSRLQMWGYSLDLIARSPLIGHGFQSFKFGSWNNPHNQHLYILTELGVIGYILFLSIFFLSYREAGKLRNLANDDFVNRFALGIQLSVVSLFVANLFGDRWSYLPLTSYFWAINAMCHRYLVFVQGENKGAMQ